MTAKPIILFLVIISLITNRFEYDFSNPQKTSFQGKVVAITDGDTFKLLKLDSTLVRVRIANIDCPERKQPFSQKSKQFTSDAIFGKTVHVNVQKNDRYGRLIADVIYDTNKNLGHELLKAGFAWHFVKYSKDKTLAALEQEARKNKVGLWIEPNAIAPWEWRSNKKKKLKQ